MKYILYFSVFLFTLNCSINKVSNIHGFRSLDTKSEKILISKTNKNDVRDILGPPSSISNFDDIWFYIERKKTNQQILKLGKKKISKNNVLLLKFDTMGLVVSKEIIDIDDMNEIKIAEKKTTKKFKQDNTIYNIFSTLREKINAPTRNRKK
tara:strand:+ start:659 stop:1114 length:456 start_codon:yes stop_codon:yes gene_type:complete